MDDMVLHIYHFFVHFSYTIYHCSIYRDFNITVRTKGNVWYYIYVLFVFSPFLIIRHYQRVIPPPVVEFFCENFEMVGFYSKKLYIYRFSRSEKNFWMYFCIYNVIFINLYALFSFPRSGKNFFKH